MAEYDRPRFESHLKKHLTSIRQNLYINPSDPLYFEKVLRYIDARSPEAHLRLGEKYERTGNMAKAKFHYYEAKRNYSPYYYEAKKALGRLRETKDESCLVSETKPYKNRLTQSLLITFILFSLFLLFLLWNQSTHVVMDKNDPAITKESVPVSFDNPDKKPLLSIGANLVRTAIQAYQETEGKMPDSLNQLISDFPSNYISYIPKEALSGSNKIVSHFNGSGGWVYQKNATDIEHIFYPNIVGETWIPYDPIQIHVIKSTHELQFISGNWILDRKHVGIGRENRTPEGTFMIKERVQNPQGKNPGVYGKAGLGMGELALHGTNNPNSIGQNVSLGCIRLRNEDIQEIYSFVPKGTVVKIMDKNLTSQPELNPLSIQSLMPEHNPKQNEKAGNIIFNWLG